MPSLRLIAPFLAAALFATAHGLDTITVLGACHNVTWNKDHYVNYNEGVWFPQYRTWSEENSNFTCHTIYEDTFLDDELKLQQHIYFTKNGVPETMAFVLYFDTTNDSGRFEAIDFIPELGGVQTQMYMLALTEEYRVRYMCTPHPNADKNINSIFIDTRRDRPPMSTINEALDVIKRNNLPVHLDKIKQTGCQRPLSDKGYISYTADEGGGSYSKTKPDENKYYHESIIPTIFNEMRSRIGN